MMIYHIKFMKIRINHHSLLKLKIKWDYKK